MKNKLQGKTALVTGASSGLGADFARQLAELGCHLILVARREERLRALQQEITAAHAVSVEVVVLDLAQEDAPQRLFDQLQSMGKQVDVLINNAGYGLFGDFSEIPWERTQNMLLVDMLAATHLMRLCLPEMIQRNEGYILNIASIGAYQPSPTYAAYSAAKSYIFSLSQAVHFELRHSGVKVSVLSPGVTRTEFLAVAGQEPSLYQRLTRMESPVVVRIGLRAMLKGRASVVTGRFNSLAAWAMRLFPSQFQAFLAAFAMRN
jgi:uncharacterized protein